MQTFDVIVVGTGGVGSAALYHLAQRGLRVVGIDRFSAGHDRGSSHGRTRIIRQAYFEHPDYVPLVQRAYEQWFHLEQTTGKRLYAQTGLLEVGPAQGVVIPGILESARRFNLPVENVPSREWAKRFPGFRIPESMVALYEENSGYLRVEDCVTTYLAEAQRLGARLKSGEPLIEWSSDGKSVMARTATDVYLAAQLVVAAGPWAAQLLYECNLPLQVLRKHVHWFETSHAAYQQSQNCPTFFFEIPEGYFYGFPVIDGDGLKAAEHSGGQMIDDPTHADRSLDSNDLARVQRFLETYLPSSAPLKHHKHSICFYTLTPDQHFVVDCHPQYDNVAFAAGLSGHGFKFVPVLGEALADLLVGELRSELKFLSADRLRCE